MDRDPNDSCKYIVSYTANVAGVIVANVFVDDIDFAGSPFSIQVAPGIHTHSHFAIL